MSIYKTIGPLVVFGWLQIPEDKCVHSMALVMKIICIFVCLQVQPDCLFKLLLSLEHQTQDSLSILELVKGDKPFKALVRNYYRFNSFHSGLTIQYQLN